MDSIYNKSKWPDIPMIAQVLNTFSYKAWAISAFVLEKKSTDKWASNGSGTKNPQITMWWSLQSIGQSEKNSWN